MIIRAIKTNQIVLELEFEFELDLEFAWPEAESWELPVVEEFVVVSWLLFEFDGLLLEPELELEPDEPAKLDSLTM